MKILIIGGKRFAGYHMVNEALARGHEVTLFNRGQTSPELFPNVATINGDRETDLSLLDGRTFDAVLDPSCYFPHHMRKSAAYFKDKGVFYLYISTVSVNDLTQPGAKEDELITRYDFDSKDLQTGNYSWLKAANEVLAREALGAENLAIVRPGLICGYRDNTDRMTYWPVKMQVQNALLCPAEDFPFQIIDGADLAAFCLHLVENRISGAFIATGPDKPYTFHDFLRECRGLVNPDCKLIPLTMAEIGNLGLTDPVLEANFPCCHADIPEGAGIYRANIQKALANGLKLRPTAQTIQAALQWHHDSAAHGDAIKVGLKPDKEKEIIAGLSAEIKNRAW